MTNVFIDGSAGTTGLRIRERLSGRTDLSLLTLPEDLRKDTAARKEMLNKADIAFLCLPDGAAVEAVSLIDNPHTAVIDTSTAHRTSPDWDYGFPELAGLRDKLVSSKRIANPGCHASGFIALVRPLVEAGLIHTDTALTCFSITGYSGGGKSMIAAYEGENVDPLYKAPRQYGLTQQHKHLKEMTALTGLALDPVFCPIVAPFYSGMEVTVPLFAKDLHGTRQNVEDVYKEAYNTGLVHFTPEAGENGFLSAAVFADHDDMEVTVSGNGERLLLVARYDNLGKGASGSAIQNMNLLLHADETTGLVCGK